MPVPVSGSNRAYYIITGNDGRSVVGTVGTDINENRTFIYLSRHFRTKGLPVPEVYAVSDDETVYLQEFLGNLSLADTFPINADYQETNLEQIEKVVRVLPHFQITGAKGLDFSRCYPEPALNGRTVTNDLSYFKYCFLKSCGVEFDERLLDSELEDLRNLIVKDADKSDTFMLRDFQSRNVMLRSGNPWVIDFQGGRRGPMQYDLVSFLWQAKAAFTTVIRQNMINAYLDEVAELSPEINTTEFLDNLPYYVLFRILQTLGAYGFRGWTERKPHFLRSIPKGADGLHELFSSPMNSTFVKMASRFPYLKELSERIVNSAKVADLRDLVKVPQAFDGLTLTVSSFSFKRGVPYDLSGNGGGFVFDCRGVHNPGRYDEYKSMTGLDAPVKDFLEKDGEIFGFLDHCKSLVDNSIRCYLIRGFTSLCVSFGCTGGRHRSVYSAESLGRYFAKTYPEVRVLIHHREQGILTVLN